MNRFRSYMLSAMTMALTMASMATVPAVDRGETGRGHYGGSAIYIKKRRWRHGKFQR